jgi:hypothetical protein
MSPAATDQYIALDATNRLADLVWHLSGCSPRAAAAAVAADPRGASPASFDEAIDVVAAALVRVKPRVPVSAA